MPSVRLQTREPPVRARESSWGFPPSGGLGYTPIDRGSIAWCHVHARMGMREAPLYWEDTRWGTDLWSLVDPATEKTGEDLEKIAISEERSPPRTKPKKWRRKCARWVIDKMAIRNRMN
ncbi:hypothetical protein Pan216_08450 [Planctomycetes bacterium Pan216]|uniref:Uncharacterized protein n=1 Tax=Kolteria novifilia TaxID=2527975 RepID=A0A518AZ48_9BACT|nr:hypothetical protein Pan216_08450 [Planctomycetes bacterium Pan216]